MLFRPLIAIAAGLAALFLPQMPRGTGEAAAVAPPGGFAGIYDFYLGGIRGGELSVAARLEAGRYRAEAAGRTAGLVRLVWDAGFAASSDGGLDGSGLAPESYEADAYTARRSQKLALRYDGGRPQLVRAEPPFEPRPWAIEPAEQAGTQDPLSAILSALALQRDETLCGRSLEVFDGRRRFSLTLEAARPEQGMMRCAALYRRVAGFKPKLMERPDWPLELWFARDAGGLWHLERAMGEMSFGIAVLKLRAG